jgi:hypothetical protein
MVVSALAALLIACAPPAPQPPAGPSTSGTANASATAAPPAQATPEKINAEVGPNEPQIFMLEPEDGSVMDSPFFLRVGVANFPIPISNVKIHVAINAASTPAGETIPKAEQHISLPRGAMEDSRFNLPLGQHRLCIQASNQNDIALQGPGMTRMIDVTIQAVDEPGNS